MRKHRSISRPGNACDNAIQCNNIQNFRSLERQFRDEILYTNSSTNQSKCINMDNISRFANAVSSLPLVDEQLTRQAMKDGQVPSSANGGRVAPKTGRFINI